MIVPRTEHIGIHVHFLREKVRNEEVTLEYCPTDFKSKEKFLAQNKAIMVDH